jgi:hypothetical protein
LDRIAQDLTISPTHAGASATWGKHERARAIFAAAIWQSSLQRKLGNSLLYCMRVGARARAALIAGGIAGSVGACSLAPHYQKPETAPAPGAYREASGWKLAMPADNESRGPWWTAFHDTTLDVLESQVTDANQDLKGAFARLQEARAQSRIAQASQFPNVGADGSANRTKDPDHLRRL